MIWDVVEFSAIDRYLFSLEVIVLRAFKDLNQSESHGREHVLLSIHAILEKAFEKLYILDNL